MFRHARNKMNATFDKRLELSKRESPFSINVCVSFLAKFLPEVAMHTGLILRGTSFSLSLAKSTRGKNSLFFPFSLNLLFLIRFPIIARVET